jgi:CRISPR-associated endonuclease Csn1
MKSKEKCANIAGNYYIGLDIGTDSVGYAVTDKSYELLKYKGEPMWGSHLFDAANQCADRRGYRTARRRLDRVQFRVHLIDTIFAKEISKIDPDFYIRKQESRLYLEDKSTQDKHVYFNDENFNERDYYQKYPTIHHLILDLMTSDEKKDLRLINIAIDWLVAHRGHFLSEVSVDHVDELREFNSIYEDFISCFDLLELDRPWADADAEEFGTILKRKRVSEKENALTKLLFGDGKPPKASEDSDIDVKTLIKFISGRKIKLNELFLKLELEEDKSVQISDEVEEYIALADDYSELIIKIVAMYEWSVLSDILGSSTYISEAKVKIYDKHKKDLVELKRFVKRNRPQQYNKIFRNSDDKLTNYTAYSYNVSSVKQGQKLPNRKCSIDDFYTFLKKELCLSDIENNYQDESDQNYLKGILAEMETRDFMPKQVITDNRVIPYQLYYVELREILDKAQKYYPFLNDKDSDGISQVDKVFSVFKFRIPYYVGPLRKDNSKYAWIERKAGNIYPWNFDSMVDEDKSEQNFIERMTNTCSYIPGKTVLPKYSLLYTKFMVLNEINNLKVNEVPISVEAKQFIFDELFCRYAKVSKKKIEEALVTNSFMQKGDILSGVDITIKSSLKSRNDFRRLLSKGILTEADVEKIIERCTYTEDKGRFKNWLKASYPDLSEDDLKYVSKLKYKDFGRLSHYFLSGLEGCDKETGETGTIMHFLWTTNDNLMQLLSEKYTFIEEISNLRKDYYSKHKLNLEDQLEEMGISNAVKRPVIRTMAVLKDVTSTIGSVPKKVFVEMARGPEEKGKRTLSRKEQILELYKNVETDTVELRKELEAMGEEANNKLQKDSLFLYYTQLGKCMYTGESINLVKLQKNSEMYDIDHIYPQSKVKDDSILNNKVLVLKEENGRKSDTYPLSGEIRASQRNFWERLKKAGLITEEKFSRLIRNTPFSDDEKMGFINRQLVETRQSTKAVTQIINLYYPETEVVFVKARLASDFRNEFLWPKSRIINDLHHAKDAYLNVVVGNVYHEKFTKKWFNINDSYNLKTDKLFTRDVKHGDEYIWKADEGLAKVKNTFKKNNIHLTRYTYCKKGGLFDQMPVKKAVGLIPLKSGLDTEKYGGYNKAAASFYVLARYNKGKKKEITFIPVELMYSDLFMNDDAFAVEYTEKFLMSIQTKKVDSIEFLLDKRPIKIKSELSFDGYRVWVNGKTSYGKQIIFSNATSLILASEHELYVHKIERVLGKLQKNANYKIDKAFDEVSEAENLMLYDILSDKYQNSIFCKMPANIGKILLDGREKFESLSFIKQLELLETITESLKTGRSAGIDLVELGGKKSCGAMITSTNFTTFKCKEMFVIDQSPAGLHVKKSVNLMDLL